MDIYMDKFKQFLKAAGQHLFQFTLRYPLAIAGTILLVFLAIFLTAFGQKFQIGGLLGILWGKKKSDTDVRIIPPPDRVDDKGNPIIPGQSDDKGFVQSPISTEIKKPGIFSDPNEVTVVHPDHGELVIPLPTGVKNQDVKEVNVISPKIVEIKSEDKGGISKSDLISLENLLK
jgi:hypothetical protein